MFAPDSFAVVKVRERNGADLFVILIADLRNADWPLVELLARDER